MKERIEGLDALRGIAAFTVFLGHIALTLPSMPILLKLPPLKIFINGHGAVILFFILSGFVLTLPFLKGVAISYQTFIFKRIIRIYPPYIISILTAMLLSNILENDGLKGYSEWLDNIWNTDVSGTIFLEHLFLIDDFYTGAFNNVVWSLVNEARISLIFPFIAFMVIKGNYKQNLFICFILTAIAELNSIYRWQESVGYLTSYFDSMHFTSMFIIGSMLAKYKNNLIIFLKEKSILFKCGLLIVAYFGYNYWYSITKITNSLGFPFGKYYSEYAIAFGTCTFIVFTLSSLTISKIFKKKPLLFLGKISYSLYLYHLIILFCLIDLLSKSVSIWIIYIIAIVIAIAISSLAWYFIENPLIRVSHIISRRRNKLISIKRHSV